MTHGSGGGGCVELKDGREDIDILAEIISDGEEITVSAGSFKLQSKVLLAADPLPLAKIESGVSVPSLFLSWLISDLYIYIIYMCVSKNIKFKNNISKKILKKSKYCF